MQNLLLQKLDLLDEPELITVVFTANLVILL